MTLASSVCVRDPHVPVLNPAFCCPDQVSNGFLNLFRGSAWMRVKTTSSPLTTVLPFVTLQYMYFTSLFV